MGGFGSGRRETTPKTDDALRLSASTLRREGCLSPGQRLITWRWASGREASISLEVYEEDIELSFTFQGAVRNQRVSLEYTANHYGGRRAWFRCPCCSRRVGVLYFRLGRFACRQCLNLKYRSQSEGPADRLRRRACKIRNRLGDDPGMIASRPKGMHWNTFSRLAEELADLEHRTRQCLIKEMARHLRITP